ncbi:MAG: right-handed parallel beta-helix repeat-containing protein, partial [Candidatus Saccharimonadales bacterium]
HQLSTSAYAYNADTLDGLDSTAFAAATGSTNYIQNSTSPQTADFTITGSGTAGSLQAASLDTAAAGILTLGGTNTTSITFADSSVLAAGKTLTLTGSTTANRPASPTDGMLYYDTDTKQLLVYNTTLAKWVADGKDAIIVAASNSTEADKAAADYVTPGTADQTKIQQAVDAANPAGSGRKTGKVVLLAGTYSLTDAVTLPNNLTFAGVGRGTWLKFANIAGQTKNMLVNTDTTTGEGIVVRDLRLDGDKATNTTGTLSGISFNGVGGGSGATARQGAVITNVFVVNFTTDGIYLSNSANSNLSNSTTQANGSYGIRIGNCSRSVIANNITQGNTAFGMSIAGTSYMTINANTITDNTGGGVLFGGTATDNNFTSNSLRENGSTVSNNSIEIAPSTSNVDRTFIVGNSIYDSAGTGAAIKISDATADDTYLSNNTFSGAGAATISDAGTNTRYVGQTTSANATNVVYRQTNSATAFSIQNASATSLLTADTTNGNVLFGSYNAGTNPLAGKLVLANATNANTVSLVTGATSTSYSLTLPTALGSTGQCLSDTTGTGTLGWATCSGGSLSTDTLTVGTATGITNMQKTAQTTAATAGAQFNIIGATGLNNTGGVLQLQGGAGNGTNMAGGAVTLLGGTPTGTGLNGAVSINGSGTGAVTIGSVTAGAVTITANAASNWGTNTGLLTITGAGGTTITTGTTNALTLNTGTTGAINMGTSGGAKTITIGNTTAASKLILTGAANTTTSNSNGIVIGSATTDATQINLELDSYNTLAETASTCTTTVNQGALYYNSSTATVRNCVDGTWQDVMSSSNLAAIVFGVVPDSGATPGDLVGLGASNNGTTGPCKVSVGAALTTVSWTACVAYTGFTNSGNTVRRVAITAGTATTTNAVAGNFQHLCLSRTTGQPALTTSAAENSFTVNASFTAAPQLCLADIKFAAANNTISGIYDTRVYTTTIKQFANVITTSPVLGGMVTVSTGDGTFVPTTGATSLISGVVVAQAGNVTANVVNTMIAIGGPVPIKATAGTRGQIILAGASGYATTSTTAGGAYTNAGVAQNSYSAACAINTDSCRGSLLTTLNVR